MTTTTEHALPTGEPSRLRGSARRQALIWLAVVLAVAVVVGGIWAFGGFDRRATPYMGTRTEFGQIIETRFWDFVVLGDAVVEADRRSIDVPLTVTSKLEDSTREITYSALILRLPDGEVLTSNYCQLGDRSHFGPFVATDALCEFDFQSNEIEAPPEGDYAATLVVLDQILYKELLTGERPRANNAVAHVELGVVQLEEEL